MSQHYIEKSVSFSCKMIELVSHMAVIQKMHKTDEHYLIWVRLQSELCRCFNSAHAKGHKSPVDFCDSFYEEADKLLDEVNVKLKSVLTKKLEEDLQTCRQCSLN